MPLIDRPWPLLHTSSLRVSTLVYVLSRACAGELLRFTSADYDTIMIRPEVNGHMEPLTDP